MTFPSIRLEGAILSADLLDSIERTEKNGQKARDFGFDPAAKVKDEISSTWATAKALWTAYQAKLSSLREGAAGTTETRNLFVIPLLTILGYAPELAEAEMLHGKSYAISHRDNTRDGLPIHIVGPFLSEPGSNPDRSSLDVRVKGVHRLSPHALVQEYLNLTEHLYGIVTNGHKFRLLRDSSRLIKLSFLEFDFERIFGEELFADFALFYRLLHASRMPTNRNEAAQSIIELYHQDALDSGSRIRDGLAAAVAFAMETVANGLLAHPENNDLRTRIDPDNGEAHSLHQNLLRWVYRTLFLLVIEERGLNHQPDATLRQRRIYRDYYSLQRLRRLADRPQLADSREADLWRSMHQTLRLYEEAGKGRPLGVAPLGSFLFREEGLQPLFRYQLDNRSLLNALHRLSIFKHPDTGKLMRINYGALDVEEFGSIYESLLELRPRIVPGTQNPTFNYAQLAGNERKTTGSYYTPDSLVQQLISTALDPVLEDRLRSAGSQPASSPDERRETQEKALLSLKICDPAVGSGHFLIAAAHRLSRRLAEIRAGDEALSLDAQRHALRDVISHCLYGVDINPLSVELCKVSLWMLAMEPGKPLSFLDHHIQCGNALLGATPEALEKGIPAVAFKPIAGDNKDYCRKFMKVNKEEVRLRDQAGDLFDRDNKPWERLGNVPTAIATLDSLPDDTPEAVRKKSETYEKAVSSADYLNARFLHDAWCAAFVWKKCRPEEGGFDYPLTNGELAKIERNPHKCPPWMREETQRLAHQYRFFHWHLSFPEVFGTEAGGFDCILGNPPWVRQEVLGHIKKILTSWDCYSSTADLSVFFTSLALTIARTNGMVGLIVPNKWLRNKYGSKLRTLIQENHQIKLLIDFGHSRSLFQGADTFPALTVLAKQTPNRDPYQFTLLETSDSDLEVETLDALISRKGLFLPSTLLRGDDWKLEDPEITLLHDRLSKCGKPLRKFLTSPIRRGVNTGLNEAFLIDEATKRQITEIELPSTSLIHPWARGADIKRWRYTPSGIYLIFTRRGTDIEKHPEIERHLATFREALTPKKTPSQKGPGRKPGAYRWFEIQDNTAYFREFEKPKILVPTILYYSEFAFVEETVYPSSKANVIPSCDLALLAILNSSTMWWIMHRRFVGMKDGALSAEVNGLNELPIPEFSAAERRQLESDCSELLNPRTHNDPRRVMLLEESINKVVQRLFGLTGDEMKTIESSMPPRDPISVAARRIGIEWKSPLEISPTSFRVANQPQLPHPDTRATYGNGDDLWNHFIRQFLLQTRHEANLNLLAEAWQLFANPATLFERRANSLPATDAETWKAHLVPQISKQGFHQWVGKLHESGFIHVDRDTLSVTLPEDSALRKLDCDEWVNYEVSLALAELASRPDIDELLTGDTRAPEAGKILEFIAA